MQVTAEQAHSRVADHASKPDVNKRHVESIKVGNAIRQGDIYVRRVRKSNVPNGPKFAGRQLAPGNSQGSRHVVQGEVELYQPPKGSNALQGPFIVAKERFEVVHPEHAHFSLPPGAYSVTYQRDFAQEEIARVQD